MKFVKISLPFKLNRSVLGLGAQAKNTVCFAKNRSAYVSPIHADLSGPEDFLKFTRDVKYFLKKKPAVIACDLHPEYQPSKYIQGLQVASPRHKNWRVRQEFWRSKSQVIQHHHAHIASCMAENGLKNQRVIGVAFDGTGLGTDSALWGAEFLVCDYKNFSRMAHLKEIPLLGGEKAILEPWRVAAAWLYTAYKDGFLNLKVNFIRGLEKKKWLVLKQMLRADFNSPLASSMGRLFDAAGALILEKKNAAYEAELAIALEKLASAPSSKPPTASYNFKIIKRNDKYIIDPSPMFKQMVFELRFKKPKAWIAYKFHLTVAEMIRKACLLLRKDAGIKKVVLSGGVFQNKILLRQSKKLLSKEGFKVFTHKDNSCNDSGISLGQAVIAGQRS